MVRQTLLATTFKVSEFLKCFSSYKNRSVRSQQKANQVLKRRSNNNSEFQGKFELGQRFTNARHYERKPIVQVTFVLRLLIFHSYDFSRDF